MNILQDLIINKREFLSPFSGKDLVLFGASLGGIKLKSYFADFGLHIKYFCDNDKTKWGKHVEGVKVIPPAELLGLDLDKTEIVISSLWAREISEQLRSLGIEKVSQNSYCDYIDYYSPDHIQNNLPRMNELFNILEDEESKRVLTAILRYRLSYNADELMASGYRQYFHPVVHPKRGDAIVDGGAFIGDTVRDFIHFVDKECTIYAFEPATDNYGELCNFIKKEKIDDRVIPINAGLSDTSQALSFLEKNTGRYGSHFDAEGNVTVNTVSIDEIVNRNQQFINLIKLDVEGFELETIKGAKETIQRCKPRLQISIYHKLADLYAIPLYIHEHFQECKYRFYMGHHRKNNPYETILYAISEYEE